MYIWLYIFSFFFSFFFTSNTEESVAFLFIIMFLFFSMAAGLRCVLLCGLHNFFTCLLFYSSENYLVFFLYTIFVFRWRINFPYRIWTGCFFALNAYWMFWACAPSACVCVCVCLPPQCLWRILRNIVHGFVSFPFLLQLKRQENQNGKRNAPRRS